MFIFTLWNIFLSLFLRFLTISIFRFFSSVFFSWWTSTSWLLPIRFARRFTFGTRPTFSSARFVSPSLFRLAPLYILWLTFLFISGWTSTFIFWFTPTTSPWGLLTNIILILFILAQTLINLLAILVFVFSVFLIFMYFACIIICVLIHFISGQSIVCICLEGRSKITNIIKVSIDYTSRINYYELLYHRLYFKRNNKKSNSLSVFVSSEVSRLDATAFLLTISAAAENNAESLRLAMRMLPILLLLPLSPATCDYAIYKNYIYFIIS